MCFFGNNVESADYLYLSLGIAENKVAVFYNKKTNSSIAISLNYKFKSQSNLESEMYDILCADSDGYFYGAFNMSQEERIRLYPELKDLDTEDLNPIVFRYKVKYEK